MKKFMVVFLLLVIYGSSSFAQDHSIAREWNEVILESIRNDFARPTIHGRNLFHTSIAMYDAWAAAQFGPGIYFVVLDNEGEKVSRRLLVY